MYLNEKHVFAGNNTSKGFYSYFDNIIQPEDAKHIYILKGGPGIGKSTFMKKFAKEMLTQGYSAEFIHCSSDNESLDGILIPELKVAILDGTAPHSIDPKLPGCVDEIVNLGQFLNNKQLDKHKYQLIQINNGKSLLYKSAYRYLQGAGLILDEINSIYDSFTDNKKFIKLSKETVNKIFKGYSPNIEYGKIRKLFSEAFTANGYISHTESLCHDKKIWAVVGENTNYTSKLLELITNEAINRGYNAECFYRPLEPEKLQHVIIPELNIILKSSENHLSYKYDEVINLHEIMNLEDLKTNISKIENNLHLYDLLIKNALEKLSETKKYHELLEVFYINSIDFNGVNECYENIISQYK